MNICIETFGCRLNRAEALEDEARLRAAGHKIVSTHATADLFVVRGCSVTAKAQRECEHLIAHLQRHYPNKRIMVTGCLPGATKTIEVAGRGGAQRVEKLGRTARAYLKVQDGCAGGCTFCIVPKFRGAARSEGFEAVVDKAKRFVEAGYHEIVVTGCNLALYADAGKRLPDLLASLAEIDAGCRIRLGSLEPWGCAGDVIDAMAAHENICRFLHIPVQSASDRILRAMNRPYTIADVEALVTKARASMPLVALGCDLMTGFPGESEGDFGQTRTMLTQWAFCNAHIFPYSERPGTAAATMKGHVQHAVRHDRAHILSAIAKANRVRYARQFVGKEVEVLVESHGEQPKGWTGEYLAFQGPVRSPFYAERISHRRELMRFVVKSADGDVLHGVEARHGG